jgi:hypothetical protein
MFKQTVKKISIYSGLLIVLSLSAPLQAASIYADAQYAFDFTDKTIGTNGTTLTYSAQAELVDPNDARDIRTDTLNAVATFWSDTGADNGAGITFTSAVGHQMTSGIGVCNDQEYDPNISGDLQNCINNDKNASLDSHQNRDWVLLIFSDANNPLLSSNLDLSTLDIAPHLDSKGKQQGRSVTYFTGIIDPTTSLAGMTYSQLTDAGGLGLTQFDVTNGKSLDPVSMTLSDYNGDQPVWGNAILIGANINGGADRPLLSGMTTVVPIPPAIWLFGSALGAIFIRRRASKA